MYFRSFGFNKLYMNVCGWEDAKKSEATCLLEKMGYLIWY